MPKVPLTPNSNGSSSSQTDFTSPRLESHMTFACPECGEEFESQQDWRRHLNEEHDYLHKTPAEFDFKEINENFHECQVCHKWVANANQAIALLQYHRFLHLPFNRTYRCRHCKGGFTRKRALCEHLYRFHSRQIIEMEKQRQVENDTAPISTEEQNSVRDPKLNSEFYIRFTCPLCGRSIDRFEQWLEHLNTHQGTSTELRMYKITGSRNHYCLQCKKLLYTTDQEKLQRHRFMHLPFRMYFKCAFCMVKKSFKSEIFRHFIYAHPRKFAEAKDYIKKPTEWGAKISYRLNIELDAMLKRNKCGSSKADETVTPPIGRTCGRPKKTSPSYNDLMKAQKVTNTLNSMKLSDKSATEHALDQSLRDFENILKMDKLQSNKILQTINDDEMKDSDLVESDDFEALCTEMFESFEAEPTHKWYKQKSGKIVNNFKSERFATNEQIICIEIDAVEDENCDKIREDESFTRTPPQKRVRLSEKFKFTPHSNRYKTSMLGVEQQKEFLETHILYLCPECGIEFDESSNWRKHVFTEHNLENAIQTNFQLLENNASYLCLDCLSIQNTTKHAELQRHRFTHMPFQTYLKCKICSKTKTSKPKMLDHLKRCHADIVTPIKQQNGLELISCKNCNKHFPTKKCFNNHQANCRQQINGNSPIASISKSFGNVSNITNNMKLLTHLKNARLRIEKIKATDIF